MRVSSGVSGLDELVGGGLPASRLYVLSGPPGSGKTTLSTQFLVEGVKRGESGLFVSMHESRSDIVEDMSGYEFGFDRAIGTDQLTFVDVFSSEGNDCFGPRGSTATPRASSIGSPGSSTRTGSSAWLSIRRCFSSTFSRTATTAKYSF